jgi:hypothetical protein
VAGSVTRAAAASPRAGAQGTRRCVGRRRDHLQAAAAGPPRVAEFVLGRREFVLGARRARAHARALGTRPRCGHARLHAHRPGPGQPRSAPGAIWPRAQARADWLVASPASSATAGGCLLHHRGQMPVAVTDLCAPPSPQALGSRPPPVRRPAASRPLMRAAGRAHRLRPDLRHHACNAASQQSGRPARHGHAVAALGFARTTPVPDNRGRHPEPSGRVRRLEHAGSWHHRPRLLLPAAACSDAAAAAAAADSHCLLSAATAGCRD